MIKEELDEKIGEFEKILQKLASDITSRILSEKLPPSDLLKKTEQSTNRLADLATNSEELMLVLKPEKAYTIKSMCKNLTQTIKNFKDVLLQNTPDPLANSRLAFEQLRKAVTDGSDLLFLMRDVRDNPSPAIDAILTFKKASETKSSVISIQAKEDIQPLIKYVLSRMDDFRTALIGLEKKVDEMKQIMRELQEESLKILSEKTSAQSDTPENKTEKKQLSLSNFGNEKN
jgi:sugar-specific transcriptional regulator TrmB